MSRIFTGIIAGIAVIGVGASAYLYTELRTKDRDQVTSVSHASIASPKQTVPPKSPGDELREEMAQKENDAARETDRDLTGDPNGTAQWTAPSSSLICGVTPRGRFMIRRNEYGETRINEDIQSMSPTFFVKWSQEQCDDTAPVKQHQLIMNEYREKEYNRTHEINVDCLMAEMHDAANGYKDERFHDPHYCRSGKYERDQAAKARDEPTSGDPVAAK